MTELKDSGPQKKRRKYGTEGDADANEAVSNDDKVLIDDDNKAAVTTVDGTDSLPTPGESSPQGTRADVNRNGNIKGATAADDNNGVKDESINRGGRMRRITIQNFMCHRNLSLDLNPHLTFISGPNGSGKSAILTAISVCLGVNASQTNRASNAKEFILSGESKATIQIVFDNSIKGYCKDKYGDFVTVERTLQQSGTSGYRLLNEKGQKVSDKREELRRLLSHYNIQIDNEFMILSQDKAKEFLTATSEFKLYSLVMKALMFDETYALNRTSIQSYEDAQSHLTEQKMQFNKLKDEISELKRKMQLKDQRNKYTEERKQIKAGIAWKYADEREGEINEIDRRINEDRAAEADLDRELETSNPESTSYAEQKTRLEQEKLDITAKRNAFENERLGTNRKVQKARENSEESRRKLKDLNAQLNQEKSRKKAKEEELAQLAAAAGNKGNRMTQLEKLKTQISDLNENIESSLYRPTELEEQIAQQSEKVRSADQDYRALQSQQNELKQRFAELKNANRNSLSAFPREYQELIKRINQNIHRFEKKPLGPIGLHVSLKKPEWSRFLEAFLQRTLLSFCVETRRDRDLLTRLADECRAKISIFTRQSDLFDLEHHRPDPEQFTNVLDVLEFDDQRVPRLLVDENSAKNVVLIADREEADSVMYRNPPNVRMALSMSKRSSSSSSSAQYGFKIASTRAGSSTSTFGTYSGQPRMKIGAQFEEENIKNELAEVEQRLRESKLKAQQLNAGLERLNDQKRKAEQELSQFRYQLRVLEKEKENLELELDEDRESAKMKTLEASIENSEEEIDRINVQLDIEGQSLLKHKEQEREIQKQLNDENSKIGLLKRDLERIRRFKEIERNRQQLIDDLRKRKNQISRQIQERESVKNRKKADFERAIEVARSLSENRIVIGNRERAMDRLRDLESQIEEIDRRQGLDFNQIQNDLRSKIEEREKLCDQIYDLEETGSMLQRDLCARQGRYQMLQAETFNHIKTSFCKSLELRGYKAGISVNDFEKKIVLSVDPNRNGNERSVTTCSGGEKSFAQIALLLSIWGKATSGLGILDEFDVFMDNNNREKSLQLILGMMRDQLNSQFVLITPLDIPLSKKEQAATDVTILRLAPPER